MLARLGVRPLIRVLDHLVTEWQHHLPEPDHPPRKGTMAEFGGWNGVEEAE